MASGRLADYLGKGLASARPATLDLHPEAVGLWYSTDTDTLSAWDGTAWQDDLSGGGLPDAPSDGNTYGRKDGAWAAVTGSSEPALLLSSIDELAPTESEKLPDLPAAGTLTGGALVYLVDADGNSVKTTLAALKTFVNTDPTIVPSSVPYRGCRAYRTSDLSSLTNGMTIPWQAEAFDSDGFWSVGLPTRIVIPAGVTKVRFAFGLEYTPGLNAGTLNINFRKNGIALALPDCVTNTAARNGTTGFSNNRVNGFTGVLSVVAGDYFEVLAAFSMTGINSVIAGTPTFLEVEVMEATI